MKKVLSSIGGLIILLVVLLATWVYAATEAHIPPRTQMIYYRGERKFGKVTITQTGSPRAVDFTETLSPIRGVIDTIVVDSTGTDTSYVVTLRDEHGRSLFGKTLSSASEPYRYAIAEADPQGTANYFRGARVDGACSLELADSNDVMTAITITIYYWQCW